MMKINFRKREEKEKIDLALQLKKICPNEKIEMKKEKFEEVCSIKIGIFKRKESFSFSQFKKAA